MDMWLTQIHLENGHKDGVQCVCVCFVVLLLCTVSSICHCLQYLDTIGNLAGHQEAACKYPLQ